MPTAGAPYEDFNTVGTPMIQTSGPVQSQGRDSFASSQVVDDQAGLFACDDPSLVAQYMQNFPPLQPTRIMGVQPSTSGEGMVYPESPSRSHYLDNHESSHITGLGIQGSTQLASTLDADNVMATALTSNVNSPPLARQATFVGMPPRYDMLNGYGEPDSLIGTGPDALDMQARSNFGVVYNHHQRTPSARRGPFKDHDQREKTAHTRRIGSCIRCRMQRIRVSLCRSA
jgi:hypothetical protein